MRLMPPSASILLLITLVVSACAPVWIQATIVDDWPSTEYVCIDLPKEEVQQAETSVKMWDRAIHNWKHLIPTENLDGSCGILVHEVSFEDANDVHPGSLAYTSEIGGNEISMVRGEYEGRTIGILSHELGHAFGAQHVAGTLMNEIYFDSNPICPDMITVVQVAAYNHIPVNELSWCE